jgi:hypothetical protein
MLELELRDKPLLDLARWAMKLDPPSYYEVGRVGKLPNEATAPQYARRRPEHRQASSQPTSHLTTMYLRIMLSDGLSHFARYARAVSTSGRSASGAATPMSLP